MTTLCAPAVQRFVDAKESLYKARKVYAKYKDSCAEASATGLLTGPCAHDHLEELTQQLQESIDRLEQDLEKATNGLLNFLSSLPAESLSVLVASSDEVTTRFTLNTPRRIHEHSSTRIS